MKIVRLTAENVKRLKAVEITPDGNVQVITGRNAQGKTSVLDAIWLALGGGSASKSTVKPIRNGEDHASVRLDLGDLVVTRTWTGDKTALTVTAADGARYTSPQGILDALVGRLSFDPLEFTRLSARDQVTALLDLVNLDVDLDDLAHKRQAAYDQRTEIGRQGKALGDVPELHPGLPEQEQSASAIITELRAAEDANRDLSIAEISRGNLTGRIAELERELSTARGSLKAAESTLAKHPLIDTAEIEARLAGVEKSNVLIRENVDRVRRVGERDRLRGDYDRFTATLDGLDKTRTDALAAATFPVDGLGFDDDGVTYQGVPFSQASSAEQISVSLAMAMALNPKLRVIRILDGSLLDADNLALIAEMAKDNDFQVWIERVSDTSGVGVVIEDGSVI